MTLKITIIDMVCEQRFCDRGALNARAIPCPKEVCSLEASRSLLIFSSAIKAPSKHGDRHAPYLVSREVCRRISGEGGNMLECCFSDVLR